MVSIFNHRKVGYENNAAEGSGDMPRLVFD